MTETRWATGQERTPLINFCDDKRWGDGKFDVQTLTHLRLTATSFPGFFPGFGGRGREKCPGDEIGLPGLINKHNSLFSS